MNKRVSIIIPAYNAAAFIPQTLDAVVRQTYKNIELVVVNDGSRDNTTGVVNAFMAGKVIEWRVIDKENGGQSSARNSGIKAAGGGILRSWIRTTSLPRNI